MAVSRTGSGCAAPGLGSEGHAIVSAHLSPVVLEHRPAPRRVLTAAVRLIGLGFFRPGGEEYAEQNGTFRPAAIRKDNVTLTKGQLVFEYPLKAQSSASRAPPGSSSYGSQPRT